MKARSDELQVFVSVIECGSISAAAEQGGQTPSAISRSLSRLEAKLGTTLINRTTRRMDLTEEGRYFFERAKAILQQMDELEERLSQHRQTPSGRLRINAPVSFGIHALTKHLLEEWSSSAPDSTGNHRSQPSLYQTATGKPRIQSALARSAVSLELNHRTMVRLGLYAAQHSAGLRGLVTGSGAL